MITKKDEEYLKSLINKYHKDHNFTEKNKYPLLENGFTTDDILKGIEVLLSRNITMSSITKKFENEFSKFVGSKYSLMVNSGSSANLLVSFALINPSKKNKLLRNDEFIIPALCWSTSLWPFIQAGLKPKFIDVDMNTFCIDPDLLMKKKYQKCRMIVNLHILGNSSNMNKIVNFAKNNKMYLIEDTCEALGSKFFKKSLGTFGDFGTFSFYYSHQITSGEGGMIVCKNKEDYNLLHTLRAHGWDRGLFGKIKNNFNFINSGFNLRPLDLTASIGLSQLKRLNKMILIRNANKQVIINALKNSDKWKHQFHFFEPIKNLQPSWFGFPLLINENYLNDKNNFIKNLNSNNIETRPILSGNFLNQTASRLYGLDKNKNQFKNTEKIDKTGFFIGLPTKKIEKYQLNFLIDNLLKIKKN